MLAAVVSLTVSAPLLADIQGSRCSMVAALLACPAMLALFWDFSPFIVSVTSLVTVTGLHTSLSNIRHEFIIFVRPSLPHTVGDATSVFLDAPIPIALASALLLMGAFFDAD